MKPLTHEWVDKAEGDWVTANREVKSRKSPNYDAVCFHAQQCIEKYLKASLQERGIAFEKTHNLIHLLELILPIEPLWESMRVPLGQLTNYAVTFRYPGETATKELAQKATRLCKALRSEIRFSLGIENTK
jgi:HEPN domain-containing protein